LHLRASDTASARRGADRLEDALRIASLGGEGGRLRLLRRVALGRVAADVAPAALAVAWERAIAAAEGQQVHGSAEAASTATCAWFEDALDAHLCLALRLLCGPAPREWHWPLAVPAWRAGMSTRQALRALLSSLLARDEAPVAVPAWVAGLVEAGHAGVLLAVFEAGDEAVLRHRLDPHVPWPDPAATDALDEDEVSAMGAPRHRGPSAPVVDPSAAPRRIVAALLRAAGRSDLVRRLPPDFLPGPVRPRWHAPADLATATRTAVPATVFPGRDAMGVEHPVVAGDQALEISTHPAANESAVDAPPSVEPTRAGGIGLLLPALQRLGFPGWLDAQPTWRDTGLLQRLFAMLLARLEVDVDDPAWRLAIVPGRAVAAPDRFVAPDGWQPALLRGEGIRERGDDIGGIRSDGSGRLPLAAWRGMRPPELPPVPHAPADHAGALSIDLVAVALSAWCTALRRYLRGAVGIGLRDLVLRPAGLSITRTHLDLHYALSRGDLRLRRHGLDLDPGWLPWFGRVVSFHYGEGGGAP
jgi:hypothetical protein